MCVYRYNCDPKKAAVDTIFKRAPSLVPIFQFIKKKTTFEQATKETFGLNTSVESVQVAVG